MAPLGVIPRVVIVDVVFSVAVPVVSVADVPNKPERNPPAEPVEPDELMLDTD